MKAAIHFIAIPDLISFVKILKYNLGIPLKTGKKIAEVGFLYFG